MTMTEPLRMWWYRACALIACVLLGATLLPAVALAHAQLSAAEPSAGSVLDTAPREIVLTFNEPVGPLSTLWTDPGGATRGVEARVEGPRMIVAVPEDAGRGTHVLTWRVVSDDGHPVGGAHVFSIGEATASTAAETTEWATRLAAAGRALLTITLAFGVGGLAAAALFAAPTPVAVRWLAWTTIPAAAVLLTGQAADLAGGPGLLARPGTWTALTTSPFVGAVVLALAALVMAIAGGRVLAAGALAAGGLSFAVAGHAGTASAWSAPVIALHAGLALFWAGSLAVLATRAGRTVALAPFGRLAPVMVAVLISAGMALSWVQIEPDLRGWVTLWTTSYGQILLAKLGVVALILGLAALNRWRLAPAETAGQPSGFSKALRVEILLMVLVLALTGAFRLTPPPRALAEPAIEAHFHGRLSGADLRLFPGRVGQNRLEIMPHDVDFGPLDPREIGFAFSHAVSRIGPIAVVARQDPDGVWRAEAILPVAGDWDVVVRILIDEFTQERLGATVSLQ